MQEIIEQVRKALAPDAAQVISIEGVPHLIVRKDCDAKALPELLERIAPKRITRTIVAHDVRGFIDYVNTFRYSITLDPDTEAELGPESRIYVGPFEAAKLEARLDDVQPGVPSYVSHLVTFACPLTREWKTWTAASGRKMNQVEFAEFLEDNLADVVEPAASELLAATLAFSNSQKAEFSSVVRLSDGSADFKWAQDNKAANAKFPDRLKLGVRVYEGLEQSYVLSARLKYRVTGSALAIWIELERPDLVQRAAYERLLALVGEKTDCAVIRAL